MMYKENWEQTKEYLEAFWNKDCLDRCSLSIAVVKDPAKQVDFSKLYTPEERFTNPEVIDNICRTMFGNKTYFAESIPAKYTDFGTAGHCTFFGCKPNYTPSTIWFDPVLEDTNSALLKTDLDNCIAYEKQQKLMQDLVKLANGDYFVSMSDNCGMVDALAEIRGTQNLLIDMLEEPDFVHECMPKIIDAWKTSEHRYYDILKENNLGGSTHGWMQVWAKGMHVQLQCDFSVMISPDLFEEFALPELEECSKAVDFASYHLDGIEEVRHLDMILSVEGINNIQWTPVAGQPKTSASIETFQKIQKAGKGLILSPQLDEIEILLKNLSPKGLRLNINNVPDDQTAIDIIKMAERYR